MSIIEIRKIGITKLDTDAVVNADNTGLWEGGGFVSPYKRLIWIRFVE